MSDYSVVAADGSCSYGTFDRYRPARELHEELGRTKNVNPVCMHKCGCMYRAIVKHERHTGWRRSEPCGCHRRAFPFKKYGLDDAAIEAEKFREIQEAVARKVAR